VFAARLQMFAGDQLGFDRVIRSLPELTHLTIDAGTKIALRLYGSARTGHQQPGAKGRGAGSVVVNPLRERILTLL